MDEHLDTILYIVLTIFLLLFSIFRKKKKLSEQVAGDTDELLTQSQSSDDWESSDDYDEMKDIQNLPDLNIIKPNEHKDKETNNEKYAPPQKEELIRKKLQSQVYETRIDDNKHKEDAEASYEEIENFDLKTAIIYSEILNRKY